MGLLPKWVYELKWSDFFGGVKEDIIKGAKTVQSSAKVVLQGAASALTPTVVWVVVVLIVGLLLYAWLRKAIRV